MWLALAVDSYPARTALSAVMHTFPFVSDSLSQRRRASSAETPLAPGTNEGPHSGLRVETPVSVDSSSCRTRCGAPVSTGGCIARPYSRDLSLTSARALRQTLERLLSHLHPSSVAAVGHRDNDDRPMGESFRSDDMFDDYYCTYESGSKSFDPLTPVDPSCPADSNVRRADHFALSIFTTRPT